MGLRAFQSLKLYPDDLMIDESKMNHLETKVNNIAINGSYHGRLVINPAAPPSNSKLQNKSATSEQDELVLIQSTQVLKK